MWLVCSLLNKPSNQIMKPNAREQNWTWTQMTNLPINVHIKKICHVACVDHIQAQMMSLNRVIIFTIGIQFYQLRMIKRALAIYLGMYQ